MISNVQKRDNSVVKFEGDKIYDVILTAFQRNGIENEEVVKSIYKKVIDTLELSKDEIMKIEEIQDLIQKAILKEGYYNIAVEFIKYRADHQKLRDMKVGLYESIGQICKVTDRENANVGNGPSSKMLQIAETSSKEFNNNYLLDKVTLDAINANKIYEHDSSWGPVGTTTCTFIPLRKFLGNGFNTGHGFIRKPKRIRTAAQLSCIALQSNQNDQHGGQAYGWYDRDLAPSIKREYEWQLMHIINTNIKSGFLDGGLSKKDMSKIENLKCDTHPTLDDMCDLIYAEREIIDKEYNEIKLRYMDILESLDREHKDKIKNLAWEYTEEETFQAMEATVHNLNSMHARAGAQVPFSSINVGTDMSKEGRLLLKCLLLAYEKGLGKGEQPLFPNICFKVKSGVNYEPNTPNFDLLLLALRVSSKRLFPTFNFQDATINKDFPEDVPIMGCRTRISWNRHAKKQTCEGRGNNSFATMNLPNLGLESKFEKVRKHDFKREFYRLCKTYNISIPEVYKYNDAVKALFVKINDTADVIIHLLVERFKYQCSFKKADFPFLMNGSWMNSETLKPNDTLYDMLKHGTLGMGYIGLAECLVAVVGKHHGESNNANKLGHAITKFLKKKCDKASDEYDLNFALLSTPAEGLSGKFISKDKKTYGIVKGVTDKEWYTNSCHIPVEYKINIFDKIKIEGAYSKYSDGGSITYVELDESPLGNIQAYYKIIQAMYEADVVYGAINFPCDRCRDCGEFGVIDGDCPHCGSSNISRIRRITGYLAEQDDFNFAKKAETKHRVVHMKLRKI